MRSGLRRQVDLFVTLVERQLRLRATRSWIGIAWPSLAPVLLLLLYAFVFGRVFDVPVPHYGEYLFAGLLPWTFLAQSFGQVITCLSNEPDLIRRSRFPHELVPMTTVAVMAGHFVVTLAGFVLYLAAVGRLHLDVLPVVVVPTLAVILLVASIGMLLALVDVYNHDVRQVLGNLLTVWFFLVPIVYRPAMVPDTLRFLRSVDPVNMIVGQFRDVLYHGHVSRPLHMVLMVVVCSTSFVVSLVLFRHVGRELAKDI